MIPIEVKRRTISMYNQMIKYYNENMGKQSQYGGTIITEELLFNLMKRRSQLTKRYENRIDSEVVWGK